MLQKLIIYIKKLTKEYEGANNRKKMKRIIKVIESIDDGLSFSFLDVGARGGLIGARGNFYILHLLKNLSLYGIEPDPKECETLRKKGYDVVMDCAAGAIEEKRSIYLTKNPGCTSIYRPNEPITKEITKSPNFDVVAEKEVWIRRVDDVFPDQVFDFIKIDVQAAAHDVLEGAKDKLESAIAVVADLYFDSVYLQQPLFCQSHALLYENNFRMARCGAGNAHGFVRQGDFLYLKDPKTVKDKRTALKLLICASIYNHWSFIEFILIRSGLSPLFSEDEKLKILSAVKIKAKKTVLKHRYQNTEWTR